MQDQPKKKILLVEDDVALAAVYRSRLELEDFDTKEVNNGEEALAAAKEFQPDLILLDAMMPKISGFDVLDILRNTPETANIRVIMLTALSQPKDKERAESLGVDDYLVKSQVVIGDVVERVRHHLGLGQSDAASRIQPSLAPAVAADSPDGSLAPQPQIADEEELAPPAPLQQPAAPIELNPNLPPQYPSAEEMQEPEIPLEELQDDQQQRPPVNPS